MMLCFHYLIRLMLFLILPLGCLKRIVSLNDNALEGSIPKQLGNHPSLRHLYLQNNSLTGEIPDFVNASKLETLTLQNNKLEGTIPQSLSHAPLGKYHILMVATINSYFLVSKHFLQTLSFFTTTCLRAPFRKIYARHVLKRIVRTALHPLKSSVRAAPHVMGCMIRTHELENVRMRRCKLDSHYLMIMDILIWQWR